LNILIIIGTRPEAIKMAILYKLLMDNDGFSVCLCLTGQHKELADEALKIFGIQADVKLENNLEAKSLLEKMALINEGLQTVVSTKRPDLIMAHGDTLTAYCAAHIAIFNRIKLAHVEAGLRSHNMHRPFPEEIIRRNIGHMADFHFAPSNNAKNNLLNEGLPDKHVYVTGNTGIDALLHVVAKLDSYTSNDDLSSFIKNQKDINSRRLLLLTMHRRENQGKDISDLYSALAEILLNNNLSLVCVEHPNPKAKAQFATTNIEEKLFISPSLSYTDFIYLMDKADLILSDSGGIQEEAPYLGKPLIVLRTETERKEIIDNKSCVLYEIENLERDIMKLLGSNHKAKQLYGDGSASKKIVEILEKYGEGMTIDEIRSK